jgi:hypothetical protein
MGSLEIAWLCSYSTSRNQWKTCHKALIIALFVIDPIRGQVEKYMVISLYNNGIEEIGLTMLTISMFSSLCLKLNTTNQK